MLKKWVFSCKKVLFSDDFVLFSLFFLAKWLYDPCCPFFEKVVKYSFEVSSIHLVGGLGEGLGSQCSLQEILVVLPENLVLQKAKYKTVNSNDSCMLFWVLVLCFRFNFKKTTHSHTHFKKIENVLYLSTDLQLYHPKTPIFLINFKNY